MGTAITSGHEGDCFVISPFGGWFDTYYGSVYKPAIEDTGLVPRRTDDIFLPSSIVDDIWKLVRESKLLLADLTGKNPNVFYELGLAHAVGKPVVLIAQDMSDVPFDLRALRTIIYDKADPDWGAKLRQSIVRAIEEVLAAPAKAVLAPFLKETEVDRPEASPLEHRLIDLEQEVEGLRRSNTNPYARNRIGRGLNDRVEISRDDAERLIANWLNEDVDVEDIVRTLEGLGVQRSWTDQMIAQARVP